MCNRIKSQNLFLHYEFCKLFKFNLLGEPLLPRPLILLIDELRGAYLRCVTIVIS